jgi:cytochrome P450
MNRKDDLMCCRTSLDHLLRNPRCLSKLQDELRNTNLSPLPQWKETNALPYLGAVVKEALRIHPAVGLLLERIVPEGGVTLCGQLFPAGTIVGCNPAVVHFDKKVYGAKYPVEEFRPERWIEASAELRSLMERSSLAFGSGKRTCIGKNISLMEIYKLVPLILTRFKVCLIQSMTKSCWLKVLCSNRYDWPIRRGNGLFGIPFLCIRRIFTYTWNWPESQFPRVVSLGDVLFQ